MIYQTIDEKTRFKELYDSITQGGSLLYAGRLLERAVRLFPHNVMLFYKKVSFTYTQIYTRACALSAHMKQMGLQPRDRVIVCYENAPEFYIAYFAAWQAGAVVAPINTFLKETEIQHIVTDAQPKFIITSSDRVHQFTNHNAQMITEVIINELKDVASFDAQDLDAHEMCALLYTSGTTGAAKGVMLSSHNIMINIIQGVARLQIDEQERIFGVLPLFHVFAQNTCVWSSTFIGATVILVPKIERRSILEALEQKPTGFLGVPALYGLLCMMKTAPIDDVKYFISGGDAMPNKIRSYFELLYRRKICNGYGLTETSPLIAVDCDDVAIPTNCIGLPAVGVEVQVRDDQGKPVPNGYVGELWVKGENVMLGYYNAPEQTEAVLQNGWLNTGDKVYIDPDGKLIIAGRTKDLIVNKGIKIYPQEVENVIMSHPNVIRVGVVGEPDDQHGEVPIAYVQLRDNEPGIEQILNELCMQHLASYKVPKRFECSTDDLPMTSTGKVDKKVLRKKVADAAQG